MQHFITKLTLLCAVIFSNGLVHGMKKEYQQETIKIVINKNGFTDNDYATFNTIVDNLIKAEQQKKRVEKSIYEKELRQFAKSHGLHWVYLPEIARELNITFTSNKEESKNFEPYMYYVPNLLCLCKDHDENFAYTLSNNIPSHIKEIIKLSLQKLHSSELLTNIAHAFNISVEKVIEDSTPVFHLSIPNKPIQPKMQSNL